MCKLCQLTFTFTDFVRGIPAAQGKMPYTSPTVTLPDGRHVMGSEKIAPELERLRPEPSLHVDDPMTEKATAAVGEFFGALVPLLLPRVPKRLLNPSSAEYFEETRKGWFGMPLSELEQSKGAKEAWEKAQPGAEKIKGLLKQRTEGPFVHGEQVTYADFIIVGSFEFIKLLGDDVYEKAMSLDPAFPKLYEACKPWLKRSDH